jgi:CRP-like cAMP-binding protein
MLQPAEHPLAALLQRLGRRGTLTAADQQAVLDLPQKLAKFRANDFIVREDDTPKHSCVLVSGFAYRHKIAGNGGRQIFSIHLRGDAIDIHNAVLHRADHNVQALTDVELAMIPVGAVRDIAASNPNVGLALWYETLIDSAIFREWTLNVGRRDARARTAHLLCEFALRLKALGTNGTNEYELPMTQDQLGDALALTSVHVNRTLMTLENEGLIERSRRSVKITDYARLAMLGDFDPAYLHLDTD